MINNNLNKLKEGIKLVPGVISIKKVIIDNKIIKYISIDKELIGKLIIQAIDKEDGEGLYNFYTKNLSERSKRFFPPYPLFSPTVKSAEELKKRIVEWKKEKDWTVLKLVQNDQIIGLVLLKRYKTDRPTSGLAVSERFQKVGIGTLLQTIIDEQAWLLGIKNLYITAAQDNLASLRLHEKCGFKKTGKLVPHFIYKNKVKVIDRYDVEMVKKIK